MGESAPDNLPRSKIIIWFSGEEIPLEATPCKNLQSLKEQTVKAAKWVHRGYDKTHQRFTTFKSETWDLEDLHFYATSQENVLKFSEDLEVKEGDFKDLVKGGAYLWMKMTPKKV